MSSSAQPSQDKTKNLEEYLKKADILLDKRFLYFAFNSLGRKVEVQLEDGTKGQGKFFTSNLDNGGVVLKNFVEDSSKNKSTETKVLERDSFVYILVPNVEEPPVFGAKKAVFKTDAEISKKKVSEQRKLIKWSADEGEGGEMLGFRLEDLADKGKWDQFEMNQKRFGLKSEFEETMYTTHLDMRSVPAELLEKAQILEAEIMGSTTDYDNRHIREERGLEALREENEDEEAKYSAVDRIASKVFERGPAGSGATAAVEDDKKPKFFNSKKSKPAESLPKPIPEDKIEPKPTLQVETKRGVPSNPPSATNIKESDNTLSMKAKPTTETRKEKSIELNGNADRTPKGAFEKTDSKVLSRQGSNMSEESSFKQKAKLSLKANSFAEPGSESQIKEEPKPKEEPKQEPKILKKESSDLVPEKKFSMSDFHPTVASKFKLKLQEKDFKKSTSTFFDCSIPNWLKKLGTMDPSAVNPSWKAAKNTTITPATLIRTPSNATPTTSTTSTTTGAGTKPAFKPNAPAFSGVPAYNRPNDPAMMFQQPFVAGGFPQPAAPMGYVPFIPAQKFAPGFTPYPQAPFSQQYSFVDPSQPSFNMAYSQNNTNRPTNTKNFNKNKN